MRIYSLLPLCLLPFIAAGESAAQEPTAYDLIPQNAAVVVRLQTPETTIAEIGAFIDKVQPGFGALAQAQSGQIGMAINNPLLAGVDQTKDWYIAVFATADEKPQPVMLIPTTDAAAMESAVGDGFFYVEKDDWVAYGQQKDLIDKFADCMTDGTDAISSLMDDRVLAEATGSHVSIFVNSASLKTTFAQQLSDAPAHIDALIEKMGEQIKQGNSAMDLDYVLDMYRDMGRIGLQVVQDSTSSVLTIEFTETALQINQLLTVSADSKSDAFLKSQPVGDMARLSSVPEGLTGYWALNGDVTVMMDWTKKMMSSMLKGQAESEKFMKMLDVMTEVKIGTLTGGMDVEIDEEQAMRFFGISEISPAAKVREAFQVFGTGMEYEIAGIKQTQSLEREAEEIDGHSVDILRMTQTLPPELDPTGIQTALNEKLYGPDGITQRIVTKSDLMFQTMGGGTEAMKKLLFGQAEWADSNLQAARAAQHEKANVVTLADIPNGALKMAKLMLGTKALPLPVTVEMLDGLEIAPSYSGFSAAAEPQRLHTSANISVGTFQGFAQIGMYVRQMMAGAGAGAER